MFSAATTYPAIARVNQNPKNRRVLRYNWFGIAEPMNFKFEQMNNLVSQCTVMLGDNLVKLS